jgi:hypothetical protein
MSPGAFGADLGAFAINKNTVTPLFSGCKQAPKRTICTFRGPGAFMQERMLLRQFGDEYLEYMKDTKKLILFIY